jgi:PAS domain-containing protein
MIMAPLQQVFDATTTPVLVRDEDGYYIYANAAAQAFLGYDQVEFDQKQLTDLVSADPKLLYQGLQFLRRYGHWSGRTLYRAKSGALLKADINIFTRTTPDGTTLDVTLIHPLPRFAANTMPVTEPEAQFGLTIVQSVLLQLLSEGFSDAQIAGLLDVEVAAVDEQVREMLGKMNVSSRTAALVVAIKTRAVL